MMKFFAQREWVVATGFMLLGAAAHLVWNPIVEYWQFVATTAVFVTVMIVWLVKEWRRLGRFITRFYCIAVIFDTLAEGLLQPFHHCTASNLMCTGRMYLVFFAFWLITHPIERWQASRRGAAAAS